MSEGGKWSRYSPFSWIRVLYDWVLGWADSPYAGAALFLLSFAEASFFPIPPDVLLMALAIGQPSRALWFSFVCSVASTAGAVAGYLIGHSFFALLGQPIVRFYAAESQYLRIQELFEQWNAVAVAIAGFTPIPFKVVTIAAGAFGVDFTTFLLAALGSRSLRFFLIGFLIFRFGPAVKEKIDRYFNELTVLFVLLLVGGFFVLKFIL